MGESPADPGLLTLTQPRGAAAEAYRTLRTNLRFSSLDRPARTVLFTSPGQQEGKSTTLANLAIVSAQAGARVVAVDCDFRRPTLHSIFGVPNDRGLTNLLLDEPCQDLPTCSGPIPGLRILPAGPIPPSPGELLTSSRMDQALSTLLADADLIMLDSPPVALVADASILAPRVDGVVLVVDATRTRRDDARRAKEQLEQVNARILGVVLNRAHVDISGYPYGK